MLLSLAVVIFALSGQAQQLCPCVPISHQWIVTACETWNCAVSAAILANGSPDVVTMPSGSDDFKWLVLRRVVTGSATIPDDAPFKLESFSTLTEATSRFAGIEDGLKPMLLTAPDGNVVIVMRSSARRRAAAR
jgi:hypothetical protein